MRIDNTTYSKLRLIGIAALAVLGLVLIGFTIKTGLNTNKVVMPEPINPLEGRVLPHLDHSAYFKDSITSPTELTKTCLKCHPNSAKEVMKTPHWTWQSGDVMRNGKNIKTGKRNQVNNFCISVVGNWKSCVSCHAGYGWKDQNYDFTKEENVDCLVCHDGSGTYSKANYGMPDKSVDLKTVASSVRRPNRDNCGICHFNGGGGMGVKHGDLDESLLNANAELDIHIGKLNFQCIDCHETKHHAISGKLNTTYTEKTKVERFDCAKCHTEKPHKEHRLNEHTARIACQTCHIPEFARKRPTKMTWDWSKAGSTTRKDDAHEYLKIKGEFHYEEEVIPTYAWYTGKMERYITGDKLDNLEEHNINNPIGSRKDPKAKIWPFKVHHANQPYDPVNNILIPPLTSGEGGYWTKFDWKYAIAKGAELNNLPYSGKYGFTKTKMYWPINHMVSTKKNALTCVQCHSPEGRINWQQLGYKHDPAQGAGKTIKK
ncbi:MAG: tetrathionate reductase family octaheme c-type cytochrome [Cytophagaceae bacterium]|nr:tetrathionate reductase family octaheme c-type cytochrome [Cytophagaceae bacterium]